MSEPAHIAAMTNPHRAVAGIGALPGPASRIA
jgi:hypothetical protein